MGNFLRCPGFGAAEGNCRRTVVKSHRKYCNACQKVNLLWIRITGAIETLEYLNTDGSRPWVAGALEMLRGELRNLTEGE
jgi:hypothetical protein